MGKGAAIVRAQMTITDLDEDRWNYLQRTVRTEYEIPADASRLCLTFSHGEEERHAEMPVSELIGLLIGMSVASVGRRLQSVVDQLRVTDVARFLDREGSVRPTTRAERVARHKPGPRYPSRTSGPGPEEQGPMEPGGMFGDGIK